MSRLDSIAWAEIIGGLTIAITYPFLSRVRLFLPLPRTPFGRGAGIVAGEAFACGLILTGVIGLLGSSPLFDLLNGTRAIVVIIFAMAAIGGALAEATNPNRRSPRDT